MLAAGDGATYASEIDRVLLGAEGGEITEGGVKPSSKANVLDEAVEMVLIRLRDGESIRWSKTPSFDGFQVLLPSSKPSQTGCCET